MSGVDSLAASIRQAFPAYVVDGVIAPHDCDECFMLRRELEGKTWAEVSVEFVEANYDVLPLLSPRAYHAFVPAWLDICVRNPDSLVTEILLVNLGSEPDTQYFNAQQARVILDAVSYITTRNMYGPDDPENVDSRAKIRQVWEPIAA